MRLLENYQLLMTFMRFTKDPTEVVTGSTKDPTEVITGFTGFNSY